VLLVPTPQRLLLLARAHLALLLLEEGGRDAQRVGLSAEEEVPQRRHEGGRLGLEEAGEEELHLLAVDDLRR